MLVHQIKIRIKPGNDIMITLFCKVSHKCTANQTGMACQIYFTIFFHRTDIQYYSK